MARKATDAEGVESPDRALIGVMVFTFARIRAIIGMNAEDYSQQSRRTLRLVEFKKLERTSYDEKENPISLRCDTLARYAGKKPFTRAGRKFWLAHNSPIQLRKSSVPGDEFLALLISLS